MGCGRAVFVALFACVMLAGLRATPPPASGNTAAAPDQLRVEVLSVRPHDPSAFTQGLLLHEGYLYESTGRGNGEARLRKVDPLTGIAVREIYVPPDDLGQYYWGEGLARVENRLIQLTYRGETALVYAVDSFEVLGNHRYVGEGWGLCHDGSRLVMSNGSDTLTFRDPDTFHVVGRLQVTEDGVPLDRLNELECVDSLVYANVFMTDYIVAIDARTGAVSARIDASGLLSSEEEQGADVLNGIAYDPDSDTFLLTGKNWPKLFEVRFVPQEFRPRAYVPLALDRR
jgi:glutamine cyclotransferase